MTYEYEKDLRVTLLNLAIGSLEEKSQTDKILKRAEAFRKFVENTDD